MTRDYSSSRRRLCRLRLAAQSIRTPTASDPAEAVRSLLAVQAQDYPGALWSIGLRTTGATRESVESAHLDGSIVRSWPQRGTLHFVAAEDLGWMLGLTGDRMIRSAAGRHRQLQLDEADFTRARAVAEARLRGGERVERGQLLAAFVEAGLRVDGQRGPHLLGRLAQEGLLVLSAQREYALLDELVPHPRELEDDEALAEYALRYLRAHGPATDRDLAWWSSLTLTQARAGIALVRDRLDTLEIDGVTYLAEAGTLTSPDRSGVDLLPGFDEYLLGYRDRSAPLAGEDLGVVVPGRNGMFLATIVVDGEVRATWRRADGRAGAPGRVDVSEIAELDDASRAGMDAALERYSAFLGRPAHRGTTSAGDSGPLS